jgi:hypothetical protein
VNNFVSLRADSPEILDIGFLARDGLFQLQGQVFVPLFIRVQLLVLEVARLIAQGKELFLERGFKIVEIADGLGFLVRSRENLGPIADGHRGHLLGFQGKSEEKHRHAD